MLRFDNKESKVMGFIDYKKKLDAIPGVTNNDNDMPDNIRMDSEYASPYNINVMNTISVELPQDFVNMTTEERIEWESSLPVKIRTFDPAAGL